MYVCMYNLYALVSCIYVRMYNLNALVSCMCVYTMCNDLYALVSCVAVCVCIQSVLVTGKSLGLLRLRQLKALTQERPTRKEKE